MEALKTWHHYLEFYKFNVLVFTDHNNLHQFMDTKSLNFRQVRLAQKLLKYNFRINYRQGKPNATADTLLRFSLRNQSKNEEFCYKNTQILL